MTPMSGDDPPMRRQLDLDTMFEWHAPDLTQMVQYKTIWAGAKEFARIIIENTSPSADQTAAIRKVREAAMTANAAIALKGKV